MSFCQVLDVIALLIGMFGGIGQGGERDNVLHGGDGMQVELHSVVGSEFDEVVVFGWFGCYDGRGVFGAGICL